jgi:hypothetical protein
MSTNEPVTGNPYIPWPTNRGSTSISRELLPLEGMASKTLRFIE